MAIDFHQYGWMTAELMSMSSAEEIMERPSLSPRQLNTWLLEY